MDRVAVVGAGIAGLTCARGLARAGRDVVLFDKGRTAGGRVSTRRFGRWAWDHGASRLCHEGFPSPVAPWHDGWVGVPSMSALARDLARGLSVRAGVRVAPLAPTEGWSLVSVAGEALGTFSTLVLAVPPPQAVELLAARSDGPSVRLCEHLGAVRMDPCLTLMVAFEEPLAGPVAVRPMRGPLASAMNDSSKPGRTTRGCWVAHSSADFARDHLERPPQSCQPALLRALLDAVVAPGAEPPRAAYATVHRWRYAHVAAPLGQSCWFDPVARLGACGDWCLGSTVEDALQSGEALAARLLA